MRPCRMHVLKCFSFKINIKLLKYFKLTSKIFCTFFVHHLACLLVPVLQCSTEGQYINWTANLDKAMNLSSNRPGLFISTNEKCLVGEHLITQGEATSFLQRLSNTFTDTIRTNQ